MSPIIVHAYWSAPKHNSNSTAVSQPPSAVTNTKLSTPDFHLTKNIFRWAGYLCNHICDLSHSGQQKLPRSFHFLQALPSPGPACAAVGESSLIKGLLSGELHVAALFGTNKAEHSLCVVVARLRCSPAVSREDHGGAELLHSTDEVCVCVCVCLCLCGCVWRGTYYCLSN